MEIKEFLEILKEKKKLMLIVIVLGIVVGILVDVLLPSYYETKVTFMVLESKMIRRKIDTKELDIDTYMKFVDNESIFYDVYTSMNIKDKFDMDFDEFKKCFDCQSISRSAIVELTVIFPDKKESYEIAREVAKRVIALNRDIVEKEIKSGYRFAEKQLDIARKDYLDSKNELENFLEKNNLFLSAEDVELARSSIAIFSNGYFLPYSNSEFSTINERGVQNFNFSMKQANSIFDIDERLFELKAKLKTTKVDNLKVKIKRDIAFYQNLKATKLKKLEEMKSKALALQNKYDREKFSYIEKYKTFLSMAKAYETLLINVRSIKIEIAGKTREMTVIGKPVPPDRAIFPRLSITLISGTFLAILIDFLYVIFLGFYRKINA